MTYIFKSERLGFRNWCKDDEPKMSSINADPEAMAFFPSTQSLDQTCTFIAKMQNQLAIKGYTYFAVDLLENNNFIGFIGLSDQVYEAEFTPCIDIGWRLDATYWGNGLATEGAKACLHYGFTNLGLEKIVSVAPKINLPSEQVMKKIGMHKVKEFVHPLLLFNERLKTCVLYEIYNTSIIDGSTLI
jgi:RimJ/RimL family protein N-acetyltransferase